MLFCGCLHDNFQLFHYNNTGKEYLTSHKHLFNIHNTQHLLCTSGKFHAIRSCQSKDTI